MVKKERTGREAMAKLRSAAGKDVGIALTSRAWMRIHARGVTAVLGAATFMTLVIPCKAFFLIVQSYMKAHPYTSRLEIKTFAVNVLCYLVLCEGFSLLSLFFSFPLSLSSSSSFHFPSLPLFFFLLFTFL
jgi:hypothetical protein